MEEEKSISLGDIFRVLKKNIILICIIVASAILIGGVYTFGVVNEKYHADTTVMVAVIRDNTSDQQNNVDYNSTMYMIESIKKLVKEDIVLEPVAAKHNGLSIEGLKRKIQILSEERTMLITIRVIDGDGEVAKQIANEVADSLIKVTNTDKFKIFNDAISVTTQATRFSYDSPNKVMYMMIFTLIGGVLACVIIFIKEFASTKYTSKKDVEQNINEKIIGSFFYDKKLKREEKNDNLKTVQLVEPTIKGFEAYNKLLSNIKYYNIDNPIKVIASVSTGPNELKSTVSANLAYCMAHNGKKVVVVDLDLRKPVIYKTFGVEKENGIIEYIDGEITEEELIKHSEAGVDIVTSGKKVINPMAILESSKLSNLINNLREKYDYVILDSAPLQACADSLVVAKLCDGVMFNIALKSSKKNEIKDSINSLKEVGVSNIGINVTKIPAEKDSGYYYYGE